MVRDRDATRGKPVTMKLVSPGEAAANTNDIPAEAGEEFVRIGEMAKKYGVTLRTLRFYEDKGLLNPKRVPWYLRATGATAGWLDGKDRADLSQKMDRLLSQLTPELQAFARGLGEIDGDVIAHDSL